MAVGAFAAMFWLSARNAEHISASVPGVDRENDERLEATYAFQSMKWYSDQRAYPTGSIPHDWREQAFQKMARDAARKSSSVKSLSWTPVGPNNIGGRVRSIAFDPANSSIVYCGSVSGGIWKSTNGGGTWSALNDFADNLVISALVVDPTNSNIIYAGTGEGYFNLDALQGIGVLKSTDGGASWAVQTNFSTPNTSFGYYYITKLLIQPDNANVLYAGMLGGVWKTTNAGVSWTKIAQGNTSVRTMDLVMHPTNFNILYATYGNFSKDGIYKTTNGGTSWSKLTTGLPAAGYQRINLGMSKSSPSTLYAVFDDSATHDTYNIYKTTDDGASWAVVTKPSNPFGGSHLGVQGWYNNCIAVHPTDPNTVLIGGINLFKTINGGASWTMKSNWYPQAPYQTVHADQHAIVYDPSNSATVYFGNDGGMYKSGDGGETYSSINNNLAITQFYSGAVHPTLDIYYGGTQDNGTLKSGVLPAWSVSQTGDGGATAVDATTPTTVYTEYVWMRIYKSVNSGASWGTVMSGIPTSASGGTSDRCLFIAPFAMDPSNSQMLVAGTFKVYRTADGGGSWGAISVDLTGDGDGTGQVGSSGSAISALAVAPSSSSTIYVGTSGSATVTAKVLFTSNGGTNWWDATSAPLPDRYVKSIAIDPGDPTRVFVAFSGYNSGHVFLTTDRGVTWSDASGNLPNVPVNALLIDPANTNNILAGTDVGMFQSVDGGATWTEQNAGFANVAVADLDYRASDNTVFAATHGRGMYKLQPLFAINQFTITASAGANGTITPSGAVIVNIGANQLFTITPDTGYHVDSLLVDGVNQGSLTTFTFTNVTANHIIRAVTQVGSTPPELPAETVLKQNYPNPFNLKTDFRYQIADANHVSLKIFNVLGREIATIVDGDKPPGEYLATWDASSMPSGVYICRLTAGNSSQMKKMMVVK